MKLTHVLSGNLEVFDNLVSGTGYYLNGATDAKQLRQSIQLYNAWDVLGLVIHKRNLDKATIELIRYFDEMFFYSPKPIILLCDDACTIGAKIAPKLKACTLHPRDTVEGSISDADLCSAFITLCCMSLPIYDLSQIEKANAKDEVFDDSKRTPLELLDMAEKLYNSLEGQR